MDADWNVVGTGEDAEERTLNVVLRWAASRDPAPAQQTKESPRDSLGAVEAVFPLLLANGDCGHMFSA